MKFNAEQLYSRPQCLDPVTTNIKIIFIFSLCLSAPNGVGGMEDFSHRSFVMGMRYLGASGNCN
jgi:hypothetical protein